MNDTWISNGLGLGTQNKIHLGFSSISSLIFRTGRKLKMVISFLSTLPSLISHPTISSKPAIFPKNSNVSNLSNSIKFVAWLKICYYQGSSILCQRSSKEDTSREKYNRRDVLKSFGTAISIVCDFFNTNLGLSN